MHRLRGQFFIPQFLIGRTYVSLKLATGFLVSLENAGNNRSPFANTVHFSEDLFPFFRGTGTIMKHSTGLVLMLVLPLLAGCGKPTPPGAGGKTTQSARIPEGLYERHAANFLAGAKHLQKIGEPKQAVASLNELVANYPESDAADEAKQILAELEKRNIDAGEEEDGGVVQNSDRDKADKFLAELPNVKSIDEEKKLLTEFGDWLRENEYKIEVTMIDGKYDLSCPYFPPETPWVRHSFLDKGNLALLPRVDDR
jgi:hypothetical protein